MFALPTVGRYRLARAPLAQALAQVRFPLQARLGTLEGIAPVQEGLGQRYPYLAQQQVQGIEVQFGPEGPQAAAGGSGVSFTFSADDGHTVILAPDSATLSAGPQYGGVEGFGERFREMLAVLTRSMNIPRCDRLGVRYLTVAVTLPERSRAWSEWFRPELIGWPGSGILDDATALASAIMQVSFTSRPTGDLAGFPVDVQTFVRHGLVPGGSSVPGIPPVSIERESYLIDIDCFVVAPQKWDDEILTGQFSALHTQIDRFFRWTLSRSGEEFFGLEELE